MTVGRIRFVGSLLVVALLIAAAYPFVNQLAAPILNPVGASLKDWTCADRSPTARASFCVTLPPPSPTDQVAWNIGQEVTAARISLMATAHGITLQTVPMTWGDLWVEDKVDQATRQLLASTLDGDLQRIAEDFGRPFSVRPKVITFASAASFEMGMQTLFSYPPQVARLLAANNGGALIVPLRSIAVNWSVLSREQPLSILRHELAHAMIREVTGSSAVIPSWFDEGVATMEQNSWTIAEDDRYVAASLVRSGQTSLSTLSSANDWIEQSGKLGGRNYQVASVAVDALQKQVGVQGIARLIEGLGKGGDFDTAFSNVSRTSVAAFSRSFPESAARGAPTKVTTTELANGEVAWAFKGADPGQAAHVTIDGRDGLSYHLAFDVMTDPSGMYASTFGSTAPAGTYFVQIVAGDAEVSTTFRVRK